MRTNEFMMALNALCHERDLSKEVVFDAIESALHAAYRRDFEQESNITVEMDRTTGDARVFVDWTVVEEVEDDRIDMVLAEARRRFGAEVEVGDVVREERTPKNFGRIAAQTAKQVILQRIREAERDRAYHEYASREGEIVVGSVQSIDSKNGLVRLSLGKAEAILPRSEQLPGERYRVGQRVRGFVAEVSRNNRGPKITLSRTHRQMLRRLLELEVPEIANGTVEIRAIAREAGARSKVAVAALQPGIDPVGACVGMKGIRIQSIVNELSGEKIDVVAWSPDESIYVANSLSPAKVIEAFLDEENDEGKTAIVVVPDKQLSLAIGKEGQNARLAAKLTGWRIDIKSASEASVERARLTEREARRREALQRRRLEEDARLAAARALLAAADTDEEEVPVAPAALSPADALAFEQEMAAPPATTAQPEETAATPPRVSEEAAAPPAEPVAPVAQPQPVAPKPVAQPKPVTQPKPAAAPAPTPKPAPQPQPEPQHEEWEEEEEEPTRTPPNRASLPFYTLNERGEQESLDRTVERKKRRKGKKKREVGDRIEDRPQDRGRSKRGRSSGSDKGSRW